MTMVPLKPLSDQIMRKILMFLILVIPIWLLQKKKTDWKLSELKTLEWDILDPDYLIWVSNGHTLIFFLNRSFLDLVEKNEKPVFLNKRVPPFSVFNLKWRAKFQIYWLRIRDSDWLDFKHFSGYKYTRSGYSRYQ